MAPDPRRPDRVVRFQKVTPENSTSAEGINAIGMLCSLVGLLIKLKWAAWVGVYCSLIYMASSKSTDDKKQLVSHFFSGDGIHAESFPTDSINAQLARATGT